MEASGVLVPSPKKILIRLPNWIGDAVMASPAVSFVVSLFPDAEVFVGGPSEVCELFRHHRPQVNLIPVARINNLKTLLKTARLLKRYNFDIAILFQNAISAAFAVKLAGIPVRIGRPADFRSILLSHRVSCRSFCHEADKFFHIARYVAVLMGRNSTISSPPNLRLFVTDSEVRKTLRKFLITEPYIMLHPGAAYGTAKMWPTSNFGEVAAYFAERYGLMVIVAGSDGECSICNDVSGFVSSRRVVNLCGKTSVRELLALQSAAKLVITNDSGPMHTACGVNTRTVAIFGPTDPLKVAPKVKHCKVIHRKVSCSPCKYRHCPGDHVCMTSITTGDVIKAAEKFFVESELVNANTDN